MDIFLGKVTQQAMNYAIRSGITITGGFAIKQCSRLLQSTPRGSIKQELVDLQTRLESKIRIISPAIDMIDLIAARGNTSLESAVSLTKDLRWAIQALGVRLSNAANEEELLRRKSARAKTREETEEELMLIVQDMRRLLVRIEDSVPLINLAITTSGVNLSTNLPATISPSRLLQASTFLTAADSDYARRSIDVIQVGPTYTLSLYMLFAGHAWRPQDDEDVRETTWKEVIHKARVKLVRVPLDRLYLLPGEADQDRHEQQDQALSSIRGDGAATEFAYQLLLIEDLDDDRVHTFEDNEPQPGPFDDVASAGIRDVVPIHQISKIFYADTGKILSIGSEGETNNPILLLKRDVEAEPPRRMMSRREDEYGGYPSDFEDQEDGDPSANPPQDLQDDIDAQLRRESSVPPAPEEPQQANGSRPWRLPLDLDPEWIAFEVYNEDPDSDEDFDYGIVDEEPIADPRRPNRQESVGSDLTNALSHLNINSASNPDQGAARLVKQPKVGPASAPAIKTSLSLLEMLIRLTALQQFRQSSHLTIEDELLNFFLEDSSTTGAGPNADYRQRVRRDARRRVGFDPYDESPIKRRGEEYLRHPRASPRPEDWERGSHFSRDTPSGTPDYVYPSVEHSPISRRPQRPQSSSSLPRARPRSVQSSPIPSTPAHPRPNGTGKSPKGNNQPVQRIMRSQTEKPGSPLARAVHTSKDSTLGTSPSSDKAEGGG